jgi:hypothetical protein
MRLESFFVSQQSVDSADFAEFAGLQYSMVYMQPFPLVE